MTTNEAVIGVVALNLNLHLKLNLNLSLNLNLTFGRLAVCALPASLELD